MAEITNQFVNTGDSGRSRGYHMETVRLSFLPELGLNRESSPSSFRIFAYHDKHPRGGKLKGWPPHQVLTLSQKEITELVSYVASSVSPSARVALASTLLQEMSDAELGRALRRSIKTREEKA